MALPPPSSLETIVLRSGVSTVYVAPERGGMATRFFVGERPVFYLDEATLLDRSKNVRGGNPVLFPSPGKLEGDRYTRGGITASMGQHGFARNAEWEETARAEESVTLRLAASASTRAVYPWDFIATYRYTLANATLRIDQRIENTGATPMPFGAGFHPYFDLPQKRKKDARVPTDATKAWDNAAKHFIDLPRPIDLTAREVDLRLLDHDAASARLELGDGHHVDVRASNELRSWIVWTLEDRDFVCLEPWSSPGNALNTGEQLLVAEPGAAVELWTEIAFV